MIASGAGVVLVWAVTAMRMRIEVADPPAADAYADGEAGALTGG